MIVPASKSTGTGRWAHALYALSRCGLAECRSLLSGTGSLDDAEKLEASLSTGHLLDAGNTVGMRSILYIGNHLSRGGAYPSVAESFAPLLLPDVRLHLVSRRRNRLVRMADMLWSIFRYGRREAPVVIDVYSSLNFNYAWLCGWACRLRGLPYACVLHGGNLPARLKRSPIRSQQLFANAKRLIAPSRYLQHHFAQHGYPSTVIPNFLPIENYEFRLRRRVAPRLLWVRAFDASYNPTLAIQVVQRLYQQYPETELCMVGPDKDGSQSACRKMADQLGVADRVRFPGCLPKADWIALSKEYDIFINTTNFDNTPVSVMEAMALGMPVVSTNAGGLPWLIDDERDGLLVPTGDDAAFAQRIIQLIRDPQWTAKISAAAREKAESFAWERIKPLWLQVLND